MPNEILLFVFALFCSALLCSALFWCSRRIGSGEEGKKGRRGEGGKAEA